MKLQFDSDQKYQLAAVRAGVELFRGQPVGTGSAQTMLALDGADTLPGMEQDLIVGNQLLAGRDLILENLRRVQAGHEIAVTEQLGTLDFSVEMETGTGKTYVYLRTLYELHKAYGFSKFLIVVPSIAIREGVLKNLEITKEHFDLLYEHPGMDFEMYDPKNRGQARTFARSQSPRILVINIDSFAKFAREEEEERRAANIIYQNSDWGVPMHYIQGARPVVVVDEPQNMETPIRRQALANLKPLFTLRYSATHRNSYNLIYRLDPVRAYDLGLVKRIEVDSAVVENGHNDAYVELLSVTATSGSVTVKLKLDVNTDGGVARKAVAIRKGARTTGETDLHALSGGRDAYRNGFILDAVNVERQSVTFSGGLTLRAGERHGGMTDAVMRQQIEDTVRLHFDKERKLQKRGIKVLSLFFIDRVANYRAQNATTGQPQKGKFAVWFEEAFAKISAEPQNAGLIPHLPEAVHNGYFSQDKNGALKDTSGETKDDDDTYTLIMRDKERLLSQEEPLRFIFSLSALREGWDNPNVFQICTLNEARSEIKKRQEIGRGLRLPVDQAGQRVFDSSINILTVFANESFADFAKALQHEIQEDCDVVFKDRVKDRRTRIQARPRETLLDDEAFKELWKRVSTGTRYRVDFDSNELVREAAQAVARISIQQVVVVSTRYGVTISRADGVGGTVKDIQARRQGIEPDWIPDILGHIQARTRLTRQTIWRILRDSGRIGDILKNPQQFVDSATEAIDAVLLKLLVDGVKYEKSPAPVEEWDMRRFASEELDAYLDALVKIDCPEKTIYEYVPIDGESGVERKFATDLDSLGNVKFYMKLPRWFRIPTPLGDYIPDWAVVFEDDKRLYFVAETKGKDQELRPSEAMKITCAKKDFELSRSTYGEIVYAAPVSDVREMVTEYSAAR